MRLGWLVFVLLSFLHAGCSDTEPVRLTGGTMGTSWSLTITDGADIDLEQLHSAVMRKLAEVNGAMSTWDPDSEISQFNLMPAGCMAVSTSFAEVVQAALDISAATGGSYDISLGPLIDLWGFGAVIEVEAPTAAQIDAALSETGYHHLQLNDRQLCKDLDGLQINLSSIAKGYGVDVIARLLAEEGIDNFLVEIGGELLARGDKDGQPWMVGVENPSSDAAQSAILALPLRDQAVATSGDYRNFFVLDGQRYAHIIDARSGRPVNNQIASVTVIGDSVMQADGWATALMTLEQERALQISDQRGLAVLLLVRDGQQFQMLANKFWLSQFGEPG